MWNISNAIGKDLFEFALADFAANVGAGPNKRIVLQLDNAGWHGPANLRIPDGIRLVHQPPYSPELQPAEHLWPLVNEPLANAFFDTIEQLDDALANRCRELVEQRDAVRASALFHWWPKTEVAK